MRFGGQLEPVTVSGRRQVDTLDKLLVCCRAFREKNTHNKKIQCNTDTNTMVTETGDSGLLFYVCIVLLHVL